MLNLIFNCSYTSTNVTFMGVKINSVLRFWIFTVLVLYFCTPNISENMNIIFDDLNVDKSFQEILNQIKSFRNGDVAEIMKQKGIQYKMNWGVSVLDLKDIAQKYSQSHLLALKLWNKQWRESMLLATLLDEPKSVTEEQMDFWTKSFENCGRV